MNENQPLDSTRKGVRAKKVGEVPEPESMSPGMAAFMGFALFFACIVASIFAFGMAFALGPLIGLLFAVIGLFFPGYRYVSIGFLSGLGVVLLLLLILRGPF